MNNSHRPFKYSLDPVIRKNSWEAVILKSELSQIEKIYLQKVEELNALQKTAADLENEIRGLQQENFSIIKESFEARKAYLEHQRQVIEKKQRDIKQTEGVKERIANQLLAVKKSIKGLEKQRENKKKEHNTLQERKGVLENDDLWLAHSQRRKT